MTAGRSARHGDLPQRYWHCAAWGKSFHQDGAIETDLTLQELERKVVDPWVTGSAFVINGAIFSSRDELKQIRITCSEQSSRYYWEKDDAAEAERAAKERAEGGYIVGLSLGGSPFSALYAGVDYTSRLLFEAVKPPEEHTHRLTIANGKARKLVANGTQTPNDSIAAVRPTMFVGSTVEGLPAAREVAAELEHDLDVTLWNQDIYAGAEMTWTQLVEQANSFDYALLIFGGDDQIKSRGIESLSVRDNVLIEYGLFVGVIGVKRTFFLFNRDHRPKIATDLAGVTPLTYRDRPDGNLRAAVGTACNDIRKTANRLGKRAVQNP